MPKKSFRDTLRDNDKAQQAWANVFGKPVNQAFLNSIPPHRPRQKREVEPTKQNEHSIQVDIMKLLKVHPRVAKVWRQNSGTFKNEYHGKTHWIRANTARGMSDIMGILKGGRMFAIEVKSEKGRIHDHQQEFLDQINASGGLAFVARSVDDVLNALERA